MTPENSTLGDRALQHRFRVATEILGVLISIAPHSASVAQLRIHTGRSARDLVKACRDLTGAQLLCADAKKRGSWQLACAPHQTTLKDVFLSVAQPFAQTEPADVGNEAGGVFHAVDLMLSQAAMAISQSALAHLQTFSLDRLKVKSKIFQCNSHPVTRDSRYDVQSDFGKIPCFI
jgi:DNA-binding IscR family transcriptional regulator